LIAPVFGDSALIVFDLGTGFPESLTSKNCFDGGDDILTGGSGDVDYLIGGTANDTISGNDGSDLVFGDHARITLYGDQSHKLLFATTIDAECSGGDDFIELGDGDDIVSHSLVSANKLHPINLRSTD
jgi:Ca2+-binding RTX toxin-like protein